MKLSELKKLIDSLKRLNKNVEKITFRELVNL